MFRAGEAITAIAPLLAAALLYAIWFRRLPSRRAVLGICLAELVFAVALIWSGTTEGLRPHEPYIPAKMHGDGVIEGHGG